MWRLFAPTAAARLCLNSRSTPAAPHSRAAARRAGPRLPRGSPVAVKAPRTAPSPKNRTTNAAPGTTALTRRGRGGKDGGRVEGSSPLQWGTGRTRHPHRHRLCPPPGRAAAPLRRAASPAGSAGGGWRWVTPGGREDSPPSRPGALRARAAAERPRTCCERRPPPPPGPAALPLLTARPQPAGCIGATAAARPRRFPPFQPLDNRPAAPHLWGAGTRRSCPRPPPCLLLAQRGCSAPRIRGPGQVRAPRPPPPPPAEAAAAGSARQQVRAGPAPAGG